MWVVNALGVCAWYWVEDLMHPERVEDALQTMPSCASGGCISDGWLLKEMRD